jgi:hypothetical protein
MATLTELVETIADVEGIEPSSVNLIARYVREAGLIATGGRGPSAARMGLTDAANLLIAVNATTTATDAAKTVSAYRKFESYEFLGRADPRPDKKYGTLGEAIEQLIDAVATGDLPEIFLNRGVPFDLQEAFSRGDIHIALRFRRSEPAAFMKIITILPPDVMTPAMAEEWVETLGGVRISFSFYPPKQPPPRRKKKNRPADRFEETTIGYQTLKSVGRLLRS